VPFPRVTLSAEGGAMTSPKGSQPSKGKFLKPEREEVKKVNKAITVAIALIMTALAFTTISPRASADPTILYVDDDSVQCPNAGYATIQSAVDAANNLDTIIVCAGTYSESVSVVGFSSLAIRAEGSALPQKSVVVNPQPQGFTSGFYVLSDGVRIEGFEIKNTNFGIWFEGSNNKFSNNYIHDITSTIYWWDGGVGISLWDMNGGSNYNMITNNVIQDIERTGILLDVAWTDGGTGINTGNTVNNNKISGTPWGAIEILNAEYTSVNQNELEACGDWGIALLNAEQAIDSSSNSMAHNSIAHCSGSWGVGVLVYAWAGSATSNDIHHNSIEDIQGAWFDVGIWIMGDYNTIHHNSVKETPSQYRDSGTGNVDFKNSWN